MRCPRPLIFTTIAAAATFSLLASGCGSNSPSSPSASSSAGHQTPQSAVSFADCMRSHGASTFPDAPPSGPNPKAAIAQLLATPQGKAALTSCGHLLPNGGQPNQSPAQNQAHVAAMLLFARCIRSHGFPSFPDPNSSGELNHEMVASAGIDLHQPAVLQAGDACTSATHGVITKAIVARFVAGQ
jgi:hypothetical protein